MPDLAHRLVGGAHRVVEPRADEFQLARTPDVLRLEGIGDAHGRARVPQDPFDLVHDQRVLGLFLPALHPPETDVAQVLHPLEIADGHAAGVHVEVRHDDLAARAQDLVGAGRDRAVGGLHDQRGLDALRIAQIDHRFECRGNQDVAILFENLVSVLHIGSPREALDPARGADVRLEEFDRNPLVVDDRAVPLDHPDNAAAVLLGEELGRVIAHVAQALDDHPLAFERAVEAGGLHVVGMAEELAKRILHAPARRLDPARDPSGVEGLSGDAGGGIDVGRVHAAVLVDDPGHLALAGAHVRRGNVLRGVDQVALGQLIGETAGDELHLMLFPLARIDPQAAFRASEGDLDERAFEGHQRGQGLHLVLMHVGGEADTALDRLHMLRMNASIAGEGLDLPPQTDTETHGIGGVADPDLLLQTRRQVHELHRPVEHDINGFAEGRLTQRCVHDIPPVLTAPAAAQRE